MEIEWIYEFINTFPASAFSAVVAGGSFLVAYKVYKHNKEQVENKMDNDLINTVTQIAGFVNYIQFILKYHDTYEISTVREIIRQIEYIDKNTLNTTQSFYFNKQFDKAIAVEISRFFMQYVGWKAFKITDPSEVFLETELIYNLQNQALKIC